MVRKIKVYKPLVGDAPIYDFIKGLDPRLAKKLLWQIYCIASGTERCMSEPHVKHFTLERYKELYELRERGNVLARIIFTIGDGEIILLSTFVKKQARDTEKALDQSIKMLSLIREHPDCAVKFKLPREVADMTLK